MTAPEYFLPSALAAEMRAAADTLEKLNRHLYAAHDPRHYPWTAWSLRREAEVVES